MDSGKKMFAGLLLLSFLGIAYMAIQFISEGRCYSISEKFSNRKPRFTLAADCNCLPGYIPSRDLTSKTVIEYICRRLCDTGDPNCNPLNVKACY